MDSYIALALDTENEEQEDDEHLLLFSALSLLVIGSEEAAALRRERRRETRQYLVRADLPPNPRSQTPWQHLFEQRADRPFITTMGVDVNTFDFLIQSGFGQKWHETPIPRADTAANGVPRTFRRSLDECGGLGLVLHYLNSTMSDTSLQQVFALVPSTVSRYIAFALDILLETLQDIPETAIAWPTGNEFNILSAIIENRHPLLRGAFGSIDGLNLPVQTSSDMEIENATYNGWLSEHFVSSVLVFSPKGKRHIILICAYLLNNCIRNDYWSSAKCPG